MKEWEVKYPPPPPPQHGEGGSLLLQQLWLSRKKVIYINLSRLTAAITWRCWLSWWTRGRQRNTCALWFVYSLHIPPTPSSGWFLSLNEVCKSYMLIIHCCPKKKKDRTMESRKIHFILPDEKQSRESNIYTSASAQTSRNVANSVLKHYE